MPFHFEKLSCFRINPNVFEPNTIKAEFTVNRCNELAQATLPSGFSQEQLLEGPLLRS